MRLAALLERGSQRLDDAAERLRRGLSDRAAVARGVLMTTAGRLSVPLLLSRVERGRERLAAQRLTPALATRRLAMQQDRLDGMARLLRSLNPDGVLDRGYVRVTGPDGRTLTTRAAGAGEAGLTLHFRDGELGVVPAGSRPAPPRKAPAPSRPEQGKLL
ncbi:MAG TPA: exodeoxyribonuclease VII large subunit [Novosphingobium sp.]|nr:exodeoxyribonuclease VII large subunit [Novosphingobium sp.]